MKRNNIPGEIKVITKAIETIRAVLKSNPQAVQEAIKIEKRIWDLIKYGPDGTIKTSELARDISYLNSLGIGNVVLIPAAFAAGGISTLVVQNILKNPQS